MAKKQADIDDVLNVIGDLASQIAVRFDQVDARFDRIEKRLDDHDKKLDQIYSVLDSHMKRIEDILQENSVRDFQQKRMESWIFQLADASGIKLKYEQ